MSDHEVVKGSGTLGAVFGASDGIGWVVLAGRTSFASSGAEQTLEHLLESGADLVSVLGPLPTADEIDRIAKEVEALGASSLMAVGGGLVLDTAKAVVLALDTGRSTGDLLAGDRESLGRRPELVAVPTTAGSGAERTPFAVVYSDGVKHSLDDPRLLPDMALIDPLLTHSVPRTSAAAAALDALAHSVESTWACRSTEESRNAAMGSLRSITRHAGPAVVDGADEAREALSFAASDAGAAIAVTRTTASHAMSYHLTSRYGIPHGHAVALTLGALFELNAGVDEDSVGDSRGVDHVRGVLADVCSVLGVEDAKAASGYMAALMARLGLESSVDAAAGQVVDRRRWVADVNAERLANNPRVLNGSDLMALARAS